LAFICGSTRSHCRKLVEAAVTKLCASPEREVEDWPALPAAAKRSQEQQLNVRQKQNSSVFKPVLLQEQNIRYLNNTWDPERRTFTFD